MWHLKSIWINKVSLIYENSFHFLLWFYFNIAQVKSAYKIDHIKPFLLVWITFIKSWNYKTEKCQCHGKNNYFELIWNSTMLNTHIRMFGKGPQSICLHFNHHHVSDAGTCRHAQHTFAVAISRNTWKIVNFSNTINWKQMSKPANWDQRIRLSVS